MPTPSLAIPRSAAAAGSLATYTQTVLQVGFAIAKARNDHARRVEAHVDLKRHVSLLFEKDPRT